MKSLQILHTYDHMAILKQELVQENNLQGLWPAPISESGSLPLSSAEPEALGSTVLGHGHVDFKLPGAGREEHRCPDTQEGNLVYGPLSPGCTEDVSVL